MLKLRQAMPFVWQGIIVGSLLTLLYTVYTMDQHYQRDSAQFRENVLRELVTRNLLIETKPGTFSFITREGYCAEPTE